MAFNPREMSLPVQALIALAIAVVLILAGLYAPFSPIQDKQKELKAAEDKVRSLSQVVGQLEDAKRRYAEFRSQLEAQQRELDNLRNIVPEDKDTDDFIRSVQEQAAASNVELRRMTAKQINMREGYAEMPFEVEVDGPYYNVLDFFARLGRVSRIINVGDMNFSGLAEGKGKKYPVRPGTTVSGTFMATTFFTRGVEAAAPAKAGKTPPPKR
jgi:type IV pilus assembly protein PilO